MRKFVYTVAAHVLQNIVKRRMKPRVIQLPITGKCNSRCIACNIWKEAGKKDIDYQSLSNALKDPFFSEIRSVGINGGEPSLYDKIDNLLEAIFVLKKLEQVYVISNALDSGKVLSMMEKIKRECTKRGIVVYLTVSIDGVGSVHDTMRGIPGAFNKTMETLSRISCNKEIYCNYLDLGCTITKHNIGKMAELEVYEERIKIPVDYHLGVPIQRLHNFSCNEFSVMDDERSRLLATEFFYGKFRYGPGLKPKLRNFLTFQYLVTKGKQRLAGCSYLRSDVTITEDLDLYLCATASRKVGNLKESCASQLVSDGYFALAESHTRKYCKNCAHYIHFPTFHGMLLFIKYYLTPPAVWLRYKFGSLWLR